MVSNQLIKIKIKNKNNKKEEKHKINLAIIKKIINIYQLLYRDVSLGYDRDRRRSRVECPPHKCY